MLFAHTDHTQDVGNQNQGYQYISPDLYFTRNSTCQNSDWASAKTCQEETDTILTFHTKLIVSKVLVQHCTVLYPITNINLKQSDVLYVLDKTYKLLHSLKMGKGGMPNPVSHNCAINLCYTFTTVCHIQILVKSFTTRV